MLYSAKQLKGLNRAHAKVLNNVNRNAVGAYANYYCPYILQLQHVFCIIVYLSFINLSNLVLVASAK